MGIVAGQSFEIVPQKTIAAKLRRVGYDAYAGRPIVVMAEDLPAGNKTIIRIICDYCHREADMRNDTYHTSIRRTGAAYCRKCTYSNERRHKEYGLDSNPIYDKEWLYNEYVVKGRTAKDIANECGKKDSVVEKMVSTYGLHKNTTRPEDILTRDTLVDLYCKRYMSLSNIASMFDGIGINTVNRLIDEYGIERREPYSEMRMWWKNEENRQFMSEYRKELWKDPAYIEKHMSRRNDPEYKNRFAISLSSYYQGIHTDEWKGFLTPERTRIRKTRKYAEWRRAVFARDNYTCQCCGSRSSSGNPVTLNAHHIRSFSNYPDLRFDVSNGITLCDKCHSTKQAGSLHQLYGTMDITEEQLNTYIKEHGVAS